MNRITDEQLRDLGIRAAEDLDLDLAGIGLTRSELAELCQLAQEWRDDMPSDSPWMAARQRCASVIAHLGGRP